MTRPNAVAGALALVALGLTALSLFAVTFAAVPLSPTLRPAIPSGAPAGGITLARAEAEVRVQFSPMPSEPVREGVASLGSIRSAEAVKAGDRMGPTELQASGISADRWVWILRFEAVIRACPPTASTAEPTCWTDPDATLEVVIDYLTGAFLTSGGEAHF